MMLPAVCLDDDGRDCGSRRHCRNHSRGLIHDQRPRLYGSWCCRHQPVLVINERDENDDVVTSVRHSECVWLTMATSDCCRDNIPTRQSVSVIAVMILSLSQPIKGNPYDQ